MTVSNRPQHFHTKSSIQIQKSKKIQAARLDSLQKSYVMLEDPTHYNKMFLFAFHSCIVLSGRSYTSLENHMPLYILRVPWVTYFISQ